MARFLAFCGTVGPAVNLIAAVGQVAAAVVAAYALWVAIGQLRQAQEALKATTSYQIQKDGRELFGTLISEPDSFKYIYQYNGFDNYSAEAELKGKTRLVQLINFYSSVFNQKEAGSIDESYWLSSKSEFCKLISIQPGKSIWNQALQNGAYRTKMVEEMKKC